MKPAFLSLAIMASLLLGAATGIDDYVFRTGPPRRRAVCRQRQN
ncbi:MAG: hypothetical protein OXF75_00085 [Acidimicrobiaceae bacterium]|nr:hypothetical protein [Acidimicrobiaceae bacterium]